MRPLATVEIPTTYTTGWGRVSKFNSKKTGKELADAVIRFGKRNGFISKSPRCAACDEVRPEMHWHHDSYDHPTIVIPLCPSCHRLRHADLGWGNNPGCSGSFDESRQVTRQAHFYRKRRTAGLCVACSCPSSRAFCAACTQRKLHNTTTRVAPGSGAARRRKPSTRRAA